MERMEKGKEKEEKRERKVGDRKSSLGEGGGGFQCSICLEMMRWERIPRSLDCGHSFCSDCLKRLFFSQQSPRRSEEGSVLFRASFQMSSSLDEQPTTKDIPSKKTKKRERRCPVCRRVVEGCETIDSIGMNYLIPETIDALESSKDFFVFLLSSFEFCFFCFFLSFCLRNLFFPKNQKKHN